MFYIFRSLDTLSIYIYYICIIIISPNRIITRYRRRFLRFEQITSFFGQERLFINFSINSILVDFVVDCCFLRLNEVRFFLITNVFLSTFASILLLIILLSIIAFFDRTKIRLFLIINAFLLKFVTTLCS